MEDLYAYPIRWHVSRLFDLDGERRCHIEISLPTEAARQRAERGVRSIAQLTQDSLDFWITEPGAEIEGWVRESDLKLAVESSLAGVHRATPAVDRRITEDMVFLQLLPDRPDALLSESPPGRFSDLTHFLDVDCRWRDYTQPARRASKVLYRALLQGASQGTDAS